MKRKKILGNLKNSNENHSLDVYVENLTHDERKVLKERAKKISQKSKTSNVGTTSEAIQFILSGEKYAIESQYIRETLKLEKFTQLPSAPKFLFGIFNLRGNIISIINLKEFFDLKDEKLSDLNRIVVLQDDDLMFGILVDKVEGIINIEESKLTLELTTHKGIRKEYLKGITSDGVILLDGGRILRDEKLIIEK